MWSMVDLECIMPEQDLDMELDAGLEPVVVVNTTYKRFVSFGTPFRCVIT